MSQHALELCTLLAYDVYGELSSRVLSILFRYGRLTLSQLSQQSDLSLRQLRHGLVVLIQQHLALHYTSPEDGHTYYEADWKSNYSLVRSGKMIRLIDERFGEAAGGVVTNLLLQGHARVGDLVEAYGLGTSDKRDAAPTAGPNRGLNRKAKSGPKVTKNGAKIENHGLTLSQLHTILNRLLQSGYIMQVKEEQFWPFEDYQDHIEREVKREQFPGGVKGPKQRLELEERVRERMRKARDGNYTNAEVNGANKGVKRPASETIPRKAAKRAKMDYGIENGVGDEETDYPLLDGNFVLRINPEKFVVSFRSQELVNLSEKRIGYTTSLVYAELLRRLEAKIDRCKDHLTTTRTSEEDSERGPSISTLELSATLSKDIDLVNSIAKEPPTNSVTKGHKLSAKPRQGADASVDGSSDEDEADGKGMFVGDTDSDDHWSEEDFSTTGRNDSFGKDQKSHMTDIKRHLLLLAEDSLHFVRLVGNRGLGEWTVDFGSLTKALKQAELEHIITERFGEVATRLVRILDEKGKLDEKQVSNIALLKQKEIRSTLTSLHESGFIELQEVPRDTTRQPSRTIYLWYFDAERCRQLVLEDCYKAMARCLQRANTEKERMRPLLTKAERTDVVGREEHYLTKIERSALQNWREKEERLLGQMGRLDRLVGTFRDY